MLFFFFFFFCCRFLAAAAESVHHLLSSAFAFLCVGRSLSTHFAFWFLGLVATWHHSALLIWFPFIPSLVLLGNRLTSVLLSTRFLYLNVTVNICCLTCVAGTTAAASVANTKVPFLFARQVSTDTARASVLLTRSRGHLCLSVSSAAVGDT